jgi:hypothetical protein
MKALRTITLIVLAGILGSCDNNYGIFDSIQSETKGASSGPFSRASVGEVLSFGGYTWARRSNIVNLANGASAWAAAQGLPPNYVCTSMATDGTKLYAALFGVGVYETSDGSTWTAESGASFAGKSIETLFAYGAARFALDHAEGATSTWTLYPFSGGALQAPATFDLQATLGIPILGMTYAGSSWWAFTSTKMYKSSDGTTFAACADASFPSSISGEISAIYSTSDGVVYFGSSGGTVYRRDATGTWTGPASTNGSLPVRALIEVGSGAATRLLVGLGATTTVSTAGYYELDTSARSLGAVILGNDSNAILTGGGTTGTTNYDTNLGGKPVNGFYSIGTTTGIRLYAAVSAAGISGASGLYYDDFNGISWSRWTSE